MPFLLLFLFLFTCAFANIADDEEFLPDVSSHHYEPKQGEIPSPGEFTTRAVTSFCPKVNPITGEYVEEATDLVVAGCEPLSLRRFYGHLTPLDFRYGGWRINPETSIMANLQWDQMSFFAGVGEENGSVVSLDKKEGNRFSFSHTQGHTNLGSLDPYQTQLFYNVELCNKEKYRFTGYVQDGTGRKREFLSNIHKWHAKVKVHCHPRSCYIKVPPSTWTPFQLPVYKEILPNGNIIRYEYVNWQDELYWPSPKLLASITAYNHNETKKLAEIQLRYSVYDWQYKREFQFDTAYDTQEGYYQQTIWDVADYTVSGSNKKTVTFLHTKRGNFQTPVLLSKVVSQGKETRYGFKTGPHFLFSVDEEDGRGFTTEFDPHTHKVTLQKGPYGVVARYVYHDGFTEVFDAENNRTLYRYDSQKRMTSCENPCRIERYIWDPEGRLSAKTIESPEGKIFLKESFLYDSEGNILEETLTGLEESYTVYRTYEKNDPYHLKRSETDGFGKKTFYFYKPGTNLLEKEDVYQGDKLLIQTSYVYDDCAVCIQKTTKAEGFHHITTFKPKQSLPCFSIAMTIEID